jgi:hypothetical protein
VTCSGRHDRLLRGIADWLLGHRIDDPGAPGYGLVVGGPDVPWASTEHNLEARAFVAELSAVLAGRPADPGTGRPCQPGLDGLDAVGAQDLAAAAGTAVERIDRAIDAELFARDGGGRAHLRQGLGDDARPLDVQALGILWLLRQDRPADAAAVEAYTDAAMAVSERRVGEQAFTGYRPFADGVGADVLWMEGTLQMRLAKARLGSDVGTLDDSIGRWVALTAPGMPLQADRAGGEDYHAWPAAGPAAWLRLSRGPFALLG